MSHYSQIFAVTCATCLNLVFPWKSPFLASMPSVLVQSSALLNLVPIYPPGNRGQTTPEWQFLIKHLEQHHTSLLQLDKRYLTQQPLWNSKLLVVQGVGGIATQLAMIATAETDPPPADASETENTPSKTNSPQPWLWVLATLLTITTSLGLGLSILNHHRNKSAKSAKDKKAPEEMAPLLFSQTSKDITLSSNGIIFAPDDETHSFHQNPAASSEMVHVPAKSDSDLQSSTTSEAVNETTRLSRVDIVEELLKDLHNPDPVKRRKSIWELGQVGDSRAVQPLVDMMVDSDSSQRSLILASISEIGIRALKPINRALLLSLQDQNSEVRKNAIRDVTRVYDMMTQISQLLAHASTDPEQEVRETAQWALNQFSRMRSVPGAPDLESLRNSITSDHLPSGSDSAAD